MTNAKTSEPEITFIAALDFEADKVRYSAKGNSPLDALNALFASKTIPSYADEYNLPDSTDLEIKVFTAILPGTPEWDKNDFDPQLEFALGHCVMATQYHDLKVR
ncbi:hypothetical protein A6E01_19470 (plasmid) [Vibrio breoganii]|uniref:Uncharacterized protein n=1 Tax=Vibrio breoganii TaxID=553239 RepID=A0AAN0XZB2_9VIBR|nr:hypothetical protein [Vibrio breoganii]ANO35395.1 hypothetical protein A6E01_19470 [Vibrio breoganii]